MPVRHAPLAKQLTFTLGTIPALAANVAENAVLFTAYGYCQKVGDANTDGLSYFFLKAHGSWENSCSSIPMKCSVSGLDRCSRHEENRHCRHDPARKRCFWVAGSCLRSSRLVPHGVGQMSPSSAARSRSYHQKVSAPNEKQL